MENNRYFEISKSNIIHNLKFYMIVANISMVLLFYSFWQIKPVIVGIDDFLGLTSHLTIYYWIGLILIIICSILIYLHGPDKKDYIYILLLIYFSLFLFGIPIFTEDNAWNPFSYYPAGEVKNVISTGHIDTMSRWPLMSYRSWPGIHMISAFVLTIANIQFENLIKYMPIFWLLCMIFIIFCVGKRFNVPSEDSFAAVFIFLASFWLPQYYYSGQSLAIIAFSSLFLLTIPKGNASRIPSVLLYSFLTITHFLTSVIYLIHSYIQLKLKNYDKELVILFSIIFIGWLIYLTPRMFEYGIRSFIDQVTTTDFFYWKSTQKFVPVTSIRTTIANFRLSYLLIYGVFIFLVCIFYFTDKIEKDAKNKIKIIFPWLIGMVPFIFVRYGDEVFERVYMLSLIPAIYMILIGISNKKIVLILMILVVILHIPSHYGDDINWQSSTIELKGSEFFALKYPSDMVLARGIRMNDAYYGGVNSYIRYSNPVMIQIPSRGFDWSKMPKNIDMSVMSVLRNTSYIMDNKRTKDFLTYYYGIDPIQDWIRLNEKNLILLYDNGYFKTYHKNGDIR